jgi:hypothetical protein
MSEEVPGMMGLTAAGSADVINYAHLIGGVL